MTQKPIFHNGAEVSIAHLAPMTFICPCPDIDRDLLIGVAFSSHCYTEGFDGEIHAQEQIVLYDAGRRPRVFCPIRYEFSIGLSEIVAGLPGKRVFQTSEHRNYVYAVPMDIEGQIYEVFFMLQRAEKVPKIDLRLTVESAYPVTVAPVLRKRPNSIRFNMLAYKILRREPVKFAAR